MADTRSKGIRIRDAFNEARRDFKWAGMWISANEWADYLPSQTTGVPTIKAQELNKALFIDPSLNNYFEREEWNEEGVYGHTVTLFRKS